VIRQSIRSDVLKRSGQAGFELLVIDEGAKIRNFVRAHNQILRK